MQPSYMVIVLLFGINVERDSLCSTSDQELLLKQIS